MVFTFVRRSDRKGPTIPGSMLVLFVWMCAQLSRSRGASRRRKRAKSSHVPPVAEWRFVDDFPIHKPYQTDLWSQSLCASTRLIIYTASSLPHCAKEGTCESRRRSFCRSAPHHETVLARARGQYEAAERANGVGSRTLPDFVETRLKYEHTTLRWIEMSLDRCAKAAPTEPQLRKPAWQGLSSYVALLSAPLISKNLEDSC
jgi:hypothetical protein